MKVNNISFGQTYLKPSIEKLSKENKDKLFYSYGLGELYPVDIYLGATSKNDLTVEISRCSIYDYLTINNLIPCTMENAAAYLFIKSMENVGKMLHGPKYPVQKTTINDLDQYSEQDIAFKILDDIETYEEDHPELQGS